MNQATRVMLQFISNNWHLEDLVGLSGLEIKHRIARKVGVSPGEAFAPQVDWETIADHLTG